jgi:hypothetical protein
MLVEIAPLASPEYSAMTQYAPAVGGSRLVVAVDVSCVCTVEMTVDA